MGYRFRVIICKSMILKNQINHSFRIICHFKLFDLIHLINFYLLRSKTFVNVCLQDIATLSGIVEIFTFMKPLIRLRRNPYVRKGGAHI